MRRERWDLYMLKSRWSIFIFVIIVGALTTGCSTLPEPKPPYYIIPTTAVGDPCKPDGMYVDTPIGFPRLCNNGKWLPLCDTSSSGGEFIEICDWYRRWGVPQNWR